MLRTPVLSNRKLLTLCQQPQWDSRLSLSEALQAQEISLKPRSAIVQMPELYADLHRQHYGHAPLELTTSHKVWTALQYVQSVCEEHRLDPAVWITAQMHGMKKFLDEQQDTGGDCPYFMSNMLCGEKAKVRYNIYVCMSDRRYKRARADSFDSRTKLEGLFCELADDEERVGGYYVACVLAGEPEFWRVCIVAAEAGDKWRAVHDMPGIAARRMFVELKGEHGSKMLDAAKKLATLRAAVAVAARYSFSLPDRISYREPFSWKSYAQLLARVCEHEHEREPVGVISGIPGIQWGVGDVV